MPAPRMRPRWSVEDRVGDEGTIEVRPLRGTLLESTVAVEYLTGRLAGTCDQVNAADLLLEQVPVEDAP